MWWLLLLLLLAVVVAGGGGGGGGVGRVGVKACVCREDTKRMDVIVRVCVCACACVRGCVGAYEKPEGREKTKPVLGGMAVPGLSTHSEPATVPSTVPLAHSARPRGPGHPPGRTHRGHHVGNVSTRSLATSRIGGG